MVPNCNLIIWWNFAPEFKLQIPHNTNILGADGKGEEDPAGWQDKNYRTFCSGTSSVAGKGSNSIACRQTVAEMWTLILFAV